MRNIFISPHFDDAIGSCAGKMQSLKNVIVCTIFTKKPVGKISQLALDLHNDWKLDDAVFHRNIENNNACASMGVKIKNLGFLDSIYRKSGNKYVCNEFEDLFNEDYQDDVLEKKIYDKLLHFIKKDDNLYFPMSFGNHIDHILMNNIGNKLISQGYSVSFYADFSYTDPVEVDGLKLIRYHFNEDVLKKKIQACMCYVSQMPDLFGSNEEAKHYFFKFADEEGFYETYYKKI